MTERIPYSEDDFDGGYDGLKTIRTVYARSPRGMIICSFPGCEWRTWDEKQMFDHVHNKTHVRCPHCKQYGGTFKLVAAIKAHIKRRHS